MATVNVYGELNCAEVDGKLARADQIYDYDKGKYQSEINDSMLTATKGDIEEAIQQLETTLAELQEAEASAVSDAEADITVAKNAAIEEIEEVVQTVDITYDTIEGEKVQLETGEGSPLMTKTVADIVTYDRSNTWLGADTVQDAVDAIAESVLVESDWLPGSDILSTDYWAYRKLNIDTTAMTATSAAGKLGSTYYSNTMLPPGIVAIRLTLDGTGNTTYPRELSGVPMTTQKVGTSDVYGYVRSWTGAKNTQITCYLNNPGNRICIQTQSSAQPTAASQLNRLASLEYKMMVPSTLKTSDVIDDLESDYTDKPLSARKGRELAERTVGTIADEPVTMDISDTSTWINNTQTRYRKWIDVTGKCRLKVTFPAAVMETGVRFAVMFSETLNMSKVSYYKAVVIENGVLEATYGNDSGNIRMMLVSCTNAANSSAALTNEMITAIEESGVTFEYYDADRTAGDYPLNAKKWGAKGDGTTDDTAALQGVINMGGTIYIPSGTYKVSDMLTIGDNTHIIMDSDTTLKGVTSGTTTRFCLLDTRNDVNETGYDGRHDIVIEGGIIDLASAITTHDTVGIGMQHASNIIVRNVTIRNCKGHCIDMGGCKNVRYENCTFEDQTPLNERMEMLQIDGTGSYGAWPFPPYTGSDWPCFDGTPCENVEIAGCRFFMNFYTPAIGNHNGWHHKHIDIHDNVFYGPGQHPDPLFNWRRGIICFQDGNGNETDLVMIHDNIFRDRYYCFQFQYVPKSGTVSNIGRIFVKNNLFVNIDNLLSPDSTSPQRCVFDGNETLTD